MYNTSMADNYMNRKTESTNIQSTNTLKIGKWDCIQIFFALHKNDCNKTLKTEQITQKYDKCL